MHPIRRQDDVETIQFPAPVRRRRRRYASARSPHAHWGWIIPLYFGLVVLGVLVGLKAPALILPYCGLSGFAFFMTALYGVIRSATR